jgi:hypothetical protein
MSEPRRTHVILDGLHDTRHARELSARWSDAGFDNSVDAAAQSASLARHDGGEMSEADVDRAAAVARCYGVELRDRAGTTFVSANDAAALRQRLAYEFKSRFATALVFGLPALGLHYAGCWLTGGSDHPRDLLYPWLFELLLVGWACIAAGWPILWNGALAARHLRATADLLTTVIVLAALLPTAAGLVWLVTTGETWLSVSRGHGPLTHAALAAVAISTLQRWWYFAHADRVAGRATLMIPRPGRLVALWLMVSAAVTAWQGREPGLAFALVLPPLLALGAIHRQSPGWSMALPVVSFGVLLLIGPEALQLPVRGVMIEIAAGFGVLMSCVFAMGWRAWPERVGGA